MGFGDGEKTARKADNAAALARRRWPIWRPALLGLAVAAAIPGGVAVWATQARIAGAVIAPGEVRAEGGATPVQHPRGGVVRMVHIREGDRVEAGEALVTLDTDDEQGKSAVIGGEIDSLIAARARLLAQRDGGSLPEFPADLSARGVSDPAVAAMLDGQRRLFEARADSQARAVDQARERVAQFEQERIGLAARLRSLHAQAPAALENARAQRALMDRGYTTRRKLAEAEAELARLQADIDAAQADDERLLRRLSEARLEIRRLDAANRERAEVELRDVESRLAALTEENALSAARLEALDVRAPVAGVILGLTAHAPGAVIAPGEIIARIVPSAAPLLVEARLKPSDVDKVETGQMATIRFGTLGGAEPPEIEAPVTLVSADRVAMGQGEPPFFRVEIALSPENLRAVAKQGGVAPMPGAPAEVFLQTGARSPASYFAAPILTSLGRVFRDP